VWVSFVAAMTLVIGLLAIGEDGLSGGQLLAVRVGTVGQEPIGESILHTAVSLDRHRWKGIVIHDLGRPAGDGESVHRLHLSYGYTGLGYHFLIGNGNGLGDGIIHAGYRWNRQEAGAHVARSVPRDAYLNEHTIGICLIGNGDRRPPTEKQMQSLISLVQRLQRELDIPREAVYRHCDLAAGLTSPGRYFPIGRLEAQLLQ
jgi:N-acetyl-anhydromuramyl-L-alanine amidase AmpD